MNAEGVFIKITVDGDALAGQNFGIDPRRTAERYGECLRAAVKAAFPQAFIEIAFGSTSIDVCDADERRRASTQREIELLAYGVRKASNYVVYGD